MTSKRNIQLADTDVRPYNELPDKRINPYKIRRIVSPLEFYLQIDLPLKERYNYGEFFLHMQTFYDDPKNRSEKSLVDGKVKKGHCYVCKDFNDEKWHRVRAHVVNNTVKTVHVFYCDFGKMQLVPFSKLLEIDPKFCRCSAQVFRGYLYDVISIGEGEEPSLLTPTACDHFRGLVEGKKLNGIVMARSDSLVTNQLPDIFCNVGVVLFERNRTKVPEAKGIHDCSINARMVDAGFAQAIGIFGGCKSIVYSTVPKVPESSRKATVERLCSPPSQEDRSNNPAVTKPSGSRNRSDIEQPPPPTWLLNLLRNYSKLGANSGEEFLSEILPDKVGKHLVRVHVSCAMGPDTIFVHLASQLESLKILQDHLGCTVSQDYPPPSKELVPGKFVACLIADDKNKGTWCRAIVTQYVVKYDQFQVMLVDYGNEVAVELYCLRELPICFKEIPSYCHRVHLDLFGLKPIGSAGSPPQGWTPDARVSFRKYLFEWQDKNPVYYMFKPHHSQWIELDNFSQRLRYNPIEGKWEAGSKVELIRHKAIDKIKEGATMLRSLYCSVGVDIRYEFVVPKSPVWHFQTVCDILVRGGFAQLEANLRDRSKIHLDVVDMYCPIIIERAPELGSSSKKMYYVATN